MDFADVARTTFACRAFTADRVPDEVLYRILDVARFAPSGGNRQGQHVIVVRDRAVRVRLAQLCYPAWNVYRAQGQAGEAPWNTVNASALDLTEAAQRHSPLALLDNLADVPALLVVALDLSVVASFDSGLDRIGVISGASVYPFAWSILLAARNEGLGGVLTTFLAGREPEAQEALGLPPHMAVAAMVPLGRPVKQLSKLTRRPVEAFTTVDRFDGPAFAG
jgi:nitroreductase